MGKTFKEGDFVLIKSPEDRFQTIGKIEEVAEEGRERVIRYNEYYFPEKTAGKSKDDFSWKTGTQLGQ